VSQQSTDHKPGLLVAYIDPYYGKNWSDSLPEKCLEEMNAKKQEIWESLQVKWQMEYFLRTTYPAENSSGNDRIISN